MSVFIVKARNQDEVPIHFDALNPSATVIYKTDVLAIKNCSCATAVTLGRAKKFDLIKNTSVIGHSVRLSHTKSFRCGQLAQCVQLAKNNYFYCFIFKDARGVIVWTSNFFELKSKFVPSISGEQQEAAAASARKRLRINSGGDEITVGAPSSTQRRVFSRRASRQGDDEEANVQLLFSPLPLPPTGAQQQHYLSIFLSSQARGEVTQQEEDDALGLHYHHQYALAEIGGSELTMNNTVVLLENYEEEKGLQQTPIQQNEEVDEEARIVHEQNMPSAKEVEEFLALDDL